VGGLKMKEIIKNIYIVSNNDKNIECETLAEAEETKEFLLEFFKKDNFIIEQKQKIVYEIEKGDKVYWGDNAARIDVITDIIKDIWGDIRYKTKELNGNRIGIAYKKDLTLIMDIRRLENETTKKYKSIY
jgi:5-methylthioribose kinase